MFFIVCVTSPVHCSIDFSPPPGWSDTWEQVKNLIPDAPSSKLVVEWPNNVNIKPGATVPVGLMKERPRLKWKTELSALYTLMLIDGGLKRIFPKVFIHWMVANIPGNLVKSGNEVMDYVQPFALEFNEDGSFIKDRELSSHPFILLVFKQPGRRIFVDETHAGCNPGIVSSRIQFAYTDLVDKYNLELVAGNFLHVPYSGYATHQIDCRFSKCTKSAWPFPIPGVNDLPECQPRQDIMDITVRGPQLDKLKEYSKYTSAYSLDSVTHVIQDTYPSGSTGKVFEYTAIEGAFSAPSGTNNLDDTLEGVVDATLFTYQNKSATQDLFFGVYPEIFVVIPLTLKYTAEPRPLTVVLSQPDDQDFDFQNILPVAGMVFDMWIVKVKEGKETEFQEGREQLIKSARNSNNVVYVTKFDVNRDILQDERTGLREETENIELTIIVYKSKAARRRAQTESRVSDDFNRFLGTFDCVMCALMKEQRRPEYFPPFD